MLCSSHHFCCLHVINEKTGIGLVELPKVAQQLSGGAGMGTQTCLHANSKLTPTTAPDAFCKATFLSSLPCSSFLQKQYNKVRGHMDGVNASLRTSLDSLTMPRLTLAELDDIIKVRTHMTCSGLH